MIGNSLVDYIAIRLSIALLRLIAPTSIIYLVGCFFRPEYFVIPIGVVAAAETLFYLLVYLPRRRRLQAPPIHTPLSLSREERRRIFAKCIAAEKASNNSATPYPTGWFLPRNTIPKREDAVDWLLWALFSPTVTRSDGSLVEAYKEEIDGYIEEIEKILGTRLEPGTDSGIRSMRITLDPVTMLHRPLVWYSIVGIVDTYTSIYLTFLGFKHYSPRKWTWSYSFPPRPILCLLSRSAPDGVVVPYWYRPHRSTAKLPLVFLHGIGIGLFPYLPFIHSIVNVDPDIGILLPELLPISMHMTPQAVAPRPQMLASLNTILESLHSTDRVGWNRVVFSAHSYGTFIAGWIVRNCVASTSGDSDDEDPLIDKIAHLVLVDPIPILLSNPSVAHNFLYREPWTTTTTTSTSSRCFPSYSAASSWQLWYFASRDADVARTLCRSFFWSEGGMWKEEVTAFLRRRLGTGSETGNVKSSMTTYHDEVDDASSSSTGTALQTQASMNQRRRKMAVILGGSDQIIPTEAIRRYLTNEETWKTRWVGRVVDDSCLEVQTGGEEEEDWEETGQLEVLYDPKLDHAKIFDDKQDMIPLLEVVRRYVRD